MEALNLPVGARSIGANRPVLDAFACEQLAKGNVVGVAPSVVGEDPLDVNPVALVESEGALHELDHRAGTLVGVELTEGKPRVVIDDRMGKLENRSRATTYNKLLQRIKTFRNHPRYGFMFENATVGGDTMAEVVSHLFRLPANGKPMTIMQLAGFPAEVIDSVVSVLCRMAFDFGLWSDGVAPLLFVCEEAHRYAPADRSIGFGPTRKAVSRIAKEGRKYGVYLGLVTQRPAELDATIISQCNTLFAMRLANDRDQALLRSAVSDAAANLLSFVPSLGTREVLAFGEGVALPTRLRFKEVPIHQLPRSEATIATVPSVAAGHDMHFVSAVLERWRGATSHRDVPNDPTINERPAARTFEPRPAEPRTVEAPMLQPSLGLDPDRFSLLKRPLR